MTDWGGKVSANAVGISLASGTLAILIATIENPLHGWWLATVISLGVLAAFSLAALLPIGLANRRSRRRGHPDTPATEAPRVLPPSNPAEWAAGCDEADDHTLAFALQHRPEDPAATPPIGEKRCTAQRPAR